MIRDALRTAVQQALAAAGLPEPSGQIVLDPPRARDHGDWATHRRAWRCAKHRRRRTRATWPRVKAGARSARPCRIWPGSRSPAPASSTSSSRRRGCPTCCARSSRRATASARSTSLAGPADQPRVRLGQPDRTAARGRWTLGRGRRRDREPARGAGRGGAPGVLPERRRQPARHVPRPRCSRATEGEQPPEDGYQGQYLVDMAARLRAELGDAVDPTTAARVGLPRRSSRSLQDDLGRIGVHFDTWFSERELHERGDVAVILARPRGAGRHLRGTTAPRWLRSTDFGDTRDRVLVRSTAPRPISATTSRTTATSSPAASRT